MDSDNLFATMFRWI